MKRLRIWLSELSLSQQLILIIFSFLIVLAIFIFAFLSPLISDIAETEMFHILHNSQNNIMNVIKNNEEISPYYDYSSESYITNLIYDENTDALTVISGNEIPQYAQDAIKNNTKSITSTTDFYLGKGEGEEENSAYLYSITEAKDDLYVISLMTDDNLNRFRESLMSGVVVTNVMFVSFLFTLLMVWVTTMIIPLTQIKNYITKIKNDDKPENLNIRRKDEIGDVADALQDMEAKLVVQNREKEEMIQNISHDLKTPIATIKSYGESIKDGIYPYETLEKSVDVIIEHANRLEKKVESLIVLNKMGYLLDNVPEGDNLLMNDVVDKVFLSLKVIRPEIEFISEMNDDTYFHGDEEPWRIVVENLVDNAIRYAKSYIKIVLKDNELLVENDGEKIDLERIDCIFRPYEKGDDGKFGLGLSIVYKVVTTYGYKVRAENLSDGVRFRVWKEVSKKKKQNKKTD